MKKETKLRIALHIVVMIILAEFMWALADYKAALISLLVYVTCAAIREMGKQDGQKEMHDECMKHFIEGATRVVKDTDLAMKALGIDEETQEKIRKAREIVHKAHCADFPVPDKIVIRKETEPQPPSFEESQGEHAKFLDSIQVGDKVTRNQDGVLVNLSQLKRVAKPAEKQGKQNLVIWTHSGGEVNLR